MKKTYCRGVSAWLAVVLFLSFTGCVSVPSEPKAEAVPVPGGPVELNRGQIITAGLVQAANTLRSGARLRPFAAVYSSLGGLRPVHLNDGARQMSDSDVNLLLRSIRTLSSSGDVRAFAVYMLAEDRDGQRWLIVHYEDRRQGATLSQYPAQPPADVEDWKPVLVEPAKPVVFSPEY